MTRLWVYGATSPAWAAGLVEARRGGGLLSAIGLICCLVVLALIGVGVLIGVLVSRRRGGGTG
jgi:hypothetical protein